MSKIILDIGNANNHYNNKSTIKEMIDITAALQESTDEDLIIKFQIWEEGNKFIDSRLKSTSLSVFNWAFYYAKDKGVKCTSSIFDENSLQFLKQYHPCFIKIACIPEIYWLVYECQDYLISVPNYEWARFFQRQGMDIMYAIRKYPTPPLEYIKLIQGLPDFDILDPSVRGLSDHTDNFELYKLYNPEIYECHIALDKKTDDPFGGDFIRTFEELEEIL